MYPTTNLNLSSLASSQAADVLRSARLAGPVTWVPELHGWIVTGRSCAVQVLRDATTFTVDDERFSTAVVLGTSMLSTDGDEHARHRAPFTTPFTGPAVATQVLPRLIAQTRERVAKLASAGEAELRTELAGPLAVEAIVDVLGLTGVDESDVLRWYRSIVAGVDRVSAGMAVEAITTEGIAALRVTIESAAHDASTMIGSAAAALTPDELFANIAVLMFGAIETSEGMIATALWHLLTEPGVVERVKSDSAAIAKVVEESLRLEPAAAVVDRYATEDVVVGGAAISRGDFVRVSLTAANRDPAFFERPDEFDLDRPNARQHLAFVQGPHVCLGLHVARAQTAAAIAEVVGQFDGLQLIEATPPAGLIFRKPDTVRVRWETR